jgi:hypothetical protein
LVHIIKRTCRVKKRKSWRLAAIFQDGRRRHHFENHWNSGFQLFIIWFWCNLVHWLKNAENNNHKSGSMPPFSKMATAAILKII